MIIIVCIPFLIQHSLYYFSLVRMGLTEWIDMLSSIPIQNLDLSVITSNMTWTMQSICRFVKAKPSQPPTMFMLAPVWFYLILILWFFLLFQRIIQRRDTLAVYFCCPLVVQWHGHLSLFFRLPAIVAKGILNKFLNSIGIILAWFR